MQASASWFGLVWFGTVCDCLIIESRVRTSNAQKCEGCQHTSNTAVSPSRALAVGYPIADMQAEMCLLAGIQRSAFRRHRRRHGLPRTRSDAGSNSAIRSRLSFSGFSWIVRAAVCPLSAGESVIRSGLRCWGSRSARPMDGGSRTDTA